ncbi:K(+)-insensitive pyrophosphate-energized proton pump [Candidatus Promineifilum breve]|uniref:K(+)-insensitive pyrophosphate-energized proton pump n=1 Tax=Candidatus Promineifilum breve TaxID=1806508 RepID=A0A160SZL7_9CHLR|nr:sodium-translocating pyrophosphatase [Candidatus Promineifilum breve]CUS02604.2 K(+)-insensitive pyrophosphate-energized proton pump [Candidatus Promineifilum breve]
MDQIFRFLEMGLSSFEVWATWLVLAIAFVGLLYALYLRRQILAEEKGTAKMIEVWEAIRQGANAYLTRQLRTILPFIVILTIALFLSVYIVPPTEFSLEVFAGYSENTIRLIVGIGRAVAFVMGAGFSLMVGQLGMRMAVEGNVRVANAARTSFKDALRIAYRTGTITGMLTDGLGLLGGTLIFMLFGKAAPDALLGFGFGGTLIALFMRVGGGIYTKAADVGADLVGKVEQDMPEDDPRNAAVIADLVGDNVGDCAGMAADIFESYEVTIVSALILGVTLTLITGYNEFILFPLFVRGIGVLASIVGTYLVKGQSDDSGNAMQAIFRGFLTSAAISVVLFGAVALVYLPDIPGGWWRPFLSTAAGVGLAIVIDRLTDYFTGTHYRPVKEIRDATSGGPATTILSGLASGYESAVWSVIVIAATIVAAILIFNGVPTEQFVSARFSADFIQFTFVLYGIAMTGIGMLTLTGNNVAMDSFGPISDNANGIGEMAGLEPKARKIMADLDAVGNTTKAITKGIAIGSAVIAAVSLFGSFITDVSLVDPEALANGIRVSSPLVFVGMLLGGALPWMFSSLAIRAVSRAAGQMVDEVRRQFRIPGILEGTRKPDYARAVTISTIAAQRDLINLAVLAVITPIVVGLLLQVEALGGFQAGIIVSGMLLAVFMSNTGGAWDNGKKLIEDEERDLAANTGKGSERHKAAVVGDTVGDPLKDTAGPALNPMIKVVNLVSLIIAPIVVRYSDRSIVTVIIAVALIGLLGWAVMRSKREAEPIAAPTVREA